MDNRFLKKIFFSMSLLSSPVHYMRLTVVCRFFFYFMHQATLLFFYTIPNFNGINQS